MFPAQFDFHRVHSPDEAVSLLSEHGYDARVLAGGQSLIPAMRYRLAQPAVLVDINRVEGMNYLREEGGELRVGALVRDTDLEFSDMVRSKHPLLLEVSRIVADPIVRFRATLVGSLCHNDPSGDWTAAALAGRASVVVRGRDGERTVGIDDFIVDSYTTAVEEGELALEARWPLPTGRSSGAYEKIERKVGDYATAAAGVLLELDDDGTVKEAGIGITAVAHVPLRVAKGEDILKGQRVTKDLLRAVAAEASAIADPTSDGRGSASYKKDVVGTLVGRAITRALGNLGVRVEA